MQTFLPFRDYEASAEALDMRRLGKQRVETMQIMRALLDPQYGWQHHPAVNMWRGYEIELGVYGLSICNEWIDRGYRDTCWGKIRALQEEAYERGLDDDPPHWLGDPKFHEAHRAMLYRKDPDFYSRFLGTFDPSIDDYIWPTS